MAQCVGNIQIKWFKTKLQNNLNHLIILTCLSKLMENVFMLKYLPSRTEFTIFYEDGMNYGYYWRLYEFGHLSIDYINIFSNAPFIRVLSVFRLTGKLYLRHFYLF